MTEIATEPQTRPLSETARTRVTRKKHRAHTERAALHEVLDQALVCHLGLVRDGYPVVLPTGFGRAGETLYLHGSTGARNLMEAADGIEVCVTVTLLDGIVYSRSVNDHSMNYRSAVVYGTARPVNEREAKLRGLRALTEHLAPGSWEHAREVNPKELAAVSVLSLDLAEASVKIRSGGPGDDPAEAAGSRAWAGVLPIHTSFGAPIPAPDLDTAITTPAHISGRRYQSRTGPSTGSR